MVKARIARKRRGLEALGGRGVTLTEEEPGEGQPHPQHGLCACSVFPSPPFLLFLRALLCGFPGTSHHRAGVCRGSSLSLPLTWLLQPPMWLLPRLHLAPGGRVRLQPAGAGHLHVNLPCPPSSWSCPSSVRSSVGSGHGLRCPHGADAEAQVCQPPQPGTWLPAPLRARQLTGVCSLWGSG